jgi:hypothetical protein
VETRAREDGENFHRPTAHPPRCAGWRLPPRCAPPPSQLGGHVTARCRPLRSGRGCVRGHSCTHPPPSFHACVYSTSKLQHADKLRYPCPSHSTHAHPHADKLRYPCPSNSTHPHPHAPRLAHSCTATTPANAMHAPMYDASRVYSHPWSFSRPTVSRIFSTERGMMPAVSYPRPPCRRMWWWVWGGVGMCVSQGTQHTGLSSAVAKWWSFARGGCTCGWVVG